MAIIISTAARNMAADAALALIDGGDGDGILRIYDGSRPAGPGTAVSTQNLLAEVTLNSPAFGSADNGVATLDATSLSTTGITNGTATWFRVLDADEVAVLDGSVSATGGGGDLQLNTTTISTGLTVEITNGSITMPSGA